MVRLGKGIVVNFFVGCLVWLSLLGCNSSQRHETLSAAQFQQELQKQGAADRQLLDVRTPEEYAGGHLAGAVNVDIKDEKFKERIAALDKQKPIWVYCLSGGRSSMAAKTLREMGFTQVYNLKGGIMAWKSEGLPVTEPAIEKEDRITQADLDEVLQQHSTVLVDFYAHWCEPCKKMEPVITRLTQQYQGKVLIYRVNVDEAKALTSDLKIEGIPLFHLYKNGRLSKVLQGYQSERQLEALLHAG